MSNYLDNYFDKQTALYNAILEKCINGGTISSAELTFIKGYKNDLKKFLGKSPIEKVFDGIKGIQGLLNDIDNETEDNDNGI